MCKLSNKQKQTLIEILIEKYGCNMDYDEFAEAMMNLFDDIPGFETIQINQANRTINLLWRKYHEHN